jgi:hypothetical protein
MRCKALAVVLPALAGCLVLVVSGCPKQTSYSPAVTTTTPAEPRAEPAKTKEPPSGEETEEQKRARGEEVMARYEDATTPPVDFAWTPETPIDPARIPDEPAAGVCEGKLFVVKHAILKQEKGEGAEAGSWDLRLLDAAPKAGEETNLFGGDRYLELTIPKAAKGVKVEMPYGSPSDKWGIDKLWFWYQTPRIDSPGGISVNPNNNVALYLEFTGWELKPAAGNPDVVGKASGKVAVGSQMPGGNAVCWLAGKFDAVIAKAD